MASMIKKVTIEKKKNTTGQMDILVHKFPFSQHDTFFSYKTWSNCDVI